MKKIKILNAVKIILTATLAVFIIYCAAGMITGGFSKPDIHTDNGPISFTFFFFAGFSALLIIAIWYPWGKKTT